jgi:hypothetical protein
VEPRIGGRIDVEYEIQGPYHGFTSYNIQCLKERVQLVLKHYCPVHPCTHIAFPFPFGSLSYLDRHALDIMISRKYSKKVASMRTELDLPMAI